MGVGVGGVEGVGAEDTDIFMGFFEREMVGLDDRGEFEGLRLKRIGVERAGNVRV